MGFMDKARAAANDLAAKADTALSSSGMGGSSSGGDTDRYLRDLGVLTYLEANGRTASPDDRERVMNALKEMESRGAIGTLTLQTSLPPPGGTVPPPPGGSVPPPPGGSAPPPTPPSQTAPPAPSAPTAPPPPPPSWMGKDDGST